MTRHALSIVGAGLASWLAAPALAQHHHVVVIGHHEAGHLGAHVDFPLPIEVEPSAFPGFDGYVTAELGFESTDMDHPTEDLFMLNPQADVRLVLLGADTGIRIYNGLTPMNVGDEMTFGMPLFHVLPVFNIPQGTIGQTYSMQFGLRDASGMHEASEPFTLTFTPVPTPGVLGFVAAGMVLSLRRWRSA